MRCVLLACGESISVELEKKHAYDKAGSFVTVDEGMILDNADRVFRSKIDDVRAGIEKGTAVSWSPSSRIRRRPASASQVVAIPFLRVFYNHPF